MPLQPPTVLAIGKPEWHIEVWLKHKDASVARCERQEPRSIDFNQSRAADHHLTMVEELVEHWLGTTFCELGLRVGQQIETPDKATLPCADEIQSMAVVDFSGPDVERDYYPIVEVVLVVHAYALQPKVPQSTPSVRNARNDTSCERITPLPNELLSGTWNSSLQFDSISSDQILRAIARIILLMKQPNLDLDALNLNRLMLFHGPPGCGKTTLCRALAQRLTIWLGRDFRAGGKLFEINTQDLLSKFYSESGRLVSQMFDKILQLARDQDTLVWVLIDEVESIAGSREQLSESGECHDSIRATNQLLTSLDRIRTQPNVVVFCTSNMKGSLDAAFLDRVDFEIRVPTPCDSAVYEIIRSTVNELIRAKLIISDEMQTTISAEELESLLPDPDDRQYIPSYAKSLPLAAWPSLPSSIIANLARRAARAGLSGRKLRKLPLLAVMSYTWGRSCMLSDALQALTKAVDEAISADDNSGTRAGAVLTAGV